ncbi:antitoxin Xre/MbcA/ParS toxin-binding domain-containing protein [uncultured Imperialibacter sp.]|uniref:antitoxin Xre/MbcA/ParS toxin-binding domain-containing protein n=1 Tax=uncultured Imperialibacter sp. TaxID=1672639 RepID=UPI0030D8993A|tara:strand:- start:47380 stop:47838 length:459 start_codon:yes stop_codon:yes gene_type:complete
MKNYNVDGLGRKMMAEEPEVIYQRLRPRVSNHTTLAFEALEGVPATIFDDVVGLFGHHDYMAEVVELNPKTIHKYQAQHIKFSPAKSELMLKLVALYRKGADTFGTRASFLNWLIKPAFGIDNRIPLHLIKTSDGIDLISEELDRIQHGDTA